MFQGNTLYLKRLKQTLKENMAKQTQAEIRSQAADLLESVMTAFMIPSVWGKGAEARRSDGAEVDTTNPKACTFCSIGALNAAQKAIGATTSAFYLAEKELSNAIYEHPLGGPYEGIVTFNDGRNKKQPVLEVFAKAADKLRE